MLVPSCPGWGLCTRLLPAPSPVSLLVDDEPGHHPFHCWSMLTVPWAYSRLIPHILLNVDNPARTKVPSLIFPESENCPFWPLEKHLRNKPSRYRKQVRNVQEYRYRKHLCTRIVRK